MPDPLREINSSDFEDIIAEGITLVEFWLPLSHPCLIQDLILKEVSRELENKLQIIKINTEDVPELKQKYDVEAIPTFLLFQNGREKRRFVGVQSKAALLNVINF